MQACGHQLQYKLVCLQNVNLCHKGHITALLIKVSTAPLQRHLGIVIVPSHSQVSSNHMFPAGLCVISCLVHLLHLIQKGDASNWTSLQKFHQNEVDECRSVQQRKVDSFPKNGPPVHWQAPQKVWRLAIPLTYHMDPFIE